MYKSITENQKYVWKTEHQKTGFAVNFPLYSRRLINTCSDLSLPPVFVRLKQGKST